MKQSPDTSFFLPLPRTCFFIAAFVRPLTRFYDVYHASIITHITFSSLSTNLPQRPYNVIPLFLDFVLCCSPSDRFPHVVVPGRFSVFIAHLPSFPTKLFPRKTCAICPFLRLRLQKIEWMSVFRTLRGFELLFSFAVLIYFPRRLQLWFCVCASPPFMHTLFVPCFPPTRLYPAFKILVFAAGNTWLLDRVLRIFV